MATSANHSLYILCCFIYNMNWSSIDDRLLFLFILIFCILFYNFHLVLSLFFSGIYVWSSPYYTIFSLLWLMQKEIVHVICGNQGYLGMLILPWFPFFQCLLCFQFLVAPVMGFCFKILQWFIHHFYVSVLMK